MNIDQNIDKYLNKISKHNTQCPTQVLVASEKLNINYVYSKDNYDQPFHIASIGKILTASIIGILCDEGLLSLDDKISNFLSAETTKNLFVFKGVDYKNDVTILNLLNHTSGMADYFESKTNAGSKFVDQALNNPDKKWSPEELVDFTRNFQQAKSKPGEFLYSDTGYILLGLIIQNITGLLFQEALKKYIFEPLDMKDSYLLFGGEPINAKQKIANIWFNGKEISELNMLSCDWAGGGVVSTLTDLHKFQKAFWSGKLISEEFLKNMKSFNNKFRSGMYYGSGMMELRFEGFFFLLRGLPRPRGHSGILGTLMFYDEPNDAHIIINMGSNKRMVSSIKAIIYIEQQISRLK